MSKHTPKPISRPVPKRNPRVLENGYVSIKQCRHGLMMYNLNDLYIGRALDLYGEWCDVELECLGQVLHPGDVVLDVGANIGTHTVYFSKKVSPGGVVYAFEPQRITYEFLCANVALNGLANVDPKRVAVGDQPGEIMIPVLDPATSQNFGSLNIEGHANGDIVKLITIDSLELQRCNLIKIDAEGMELPVLRGAAKTIKNCRPFLFVENNSNEGSPETIQALFDLGYKCWWHIATYYNANNFFKNKENVWPNVFPESNMLCVPEELHLDVTGFVPVIGATDSWVQALTRVGILKS